MQRVPFDRFLDDLALYGIEASKREAREDLETVWAHLPRSTREAYLDELGIPSGEHDQVTPQLVGSDVLFAIPGDEDDAEAPSVEAAEALEALARGSALDEADLDGAALDEAPLDEDAAPVDPALTGLFGEDAELLSGDELEAVEAAGLEELALDDAALDLDGLEDVELDEAPLDDVELAEIEPEALDEAELEDATLDEADLDEADLDEAGPESPEAREGRERDEAHARYEPPKNTREVEVYPVYEPYAYVRILYDLDHHQYLYEVIEPELSEREAKVLQFIEETIVDVLDIGLSTLNQDAAKEMIITLTDQVISDYSIEVDDRSRMKLTYYTVRDFLGFGKLDIIMRDALIEDISCDGSDIPIFLYHRKYESVASTVVYKTDAELDSFVIKLAQRSGKHISIADPLLDARLPDGSRLNATLSREVTASGSTFTVRKFKPEPFTPPDLIRFGTQSPEMQAYLWMAIQHGASLILAGGTASGKTTALNAMLLFIPPQMKIVSIEDTRELNLPHPNWIPGTTRSGFGPRDDSGRQAGEIDMFQLLKAALRQRPEYIAVGEVRGEEATVLFQAMATGHAAYGTMHADSVTSVIHRLEGKPISIPRPLLEALDIVCIQIQTRIGGKRVRRTKELVEIVGLDPNTKELLTNEVFRWDPATDRFHPSGISYVLERIQRENNLSRRELQEEMENRTLIIEWLVEKGVRDYVEVAKIVQSYYNESEATMARVRADLEELREGGETTAGPNLADDVDLDVALDEDVDGADIDPFPDLPVPDVGLEDANVDGEPIDTVDDGDLDDGDLDEVDLEEPALDDADLHEAPIEEAGLDEADPYDEQAGDQDTPGLSRIAPAALTEDIEDAALDEADLDEVDDDEADDEEA